MEASQRAPTPAPGDWNGDQGGRWRSRDNDCNSVVMTKKNPHIGSTFESWLDEAGIRDEVTVAAITSLTHAQKKRAADRPPAENESRLAEPLSSARCRRGRH
jgi:hypothetical protein